MNKNTLIIDIETTGLPLDQVQQFKPEFKAGGNVKDPVKIQAAIAEKEETWKSELALSAVTGRVLCVGMLSESGFSTVFGDNHESLIIEDVFNLLKDAIFAGRPIVGFYSRTFDIPFLIRRGFATGVKVPSCFWEGRYLNSAFVDVAERWACGNKDPRDRISLDHLSKFLGTGAKNGEGADFGRLWVENRVQALAYLENDCRLTQAAYERLYA